MWGEDSELEFRVCFQLEMPAGNTECPFSPLKQVPVRNRERASFILPATVSITVSTHKHH